MPYSVSMPWTSDGREWVTRMFTQPYYGGCARCHSAEAVSNSGFDSVSSPDSVIAQPAIFTPGLFPNPE